MMPYAKALWTLPGTCQGPFPPAFRAFRVFFYRVRSRVSGWGLEDAGDARTPIQPDFREGQGFGGHLLPLFLFWVP